MHGAAEDPIRRLDARLHNTRAVERLNAFTADAMPPVLQDRIAFLVENLPALEELSRDTLVHGDLHGSQILLAEDRRRLAGVIDWGDVHLGDPTADFAAVHSLLPRDCHDLFFQAYGAVDLLSWSAAKGRAIRHTIAVLTQAVEVRDAASILEAQSCFKRLAEN